MTGLKEGGRLHILSVSKDLVISGDKEGHCGVLLSVMGYSPASSLAEREHQDGRGESCCGSRTDSRAFHTALPGLSHRIPRITAAQKMSSFGKVLQ